MIIYPSIYFFNIDPTATGVFSDREFCLENDAQIATASTCQIVIALMPKVMMTDGLVGGGDLFNYLGLSLM